MPDNNRFTLAEYASLAGLDDVQMQFVHTLQDYQAVLHSAPFIEANNKTVNKTAVGTVYPKGHTRGYNEGVPVEKALAKEVLDQTCMLETHNEIDNKILQMHGNSAEWRMRQDQMFSRGLALSFVDMIFNSDLATDSRSFNGLYSRYGQLSDQVIDAGGTAGAGNLTDIWLVNWDPTTVHLIHPEGTSAGLEMNFENNVDCRDAKGNLFKGSRTSFSWAFGLAIPDPSQVVRIANVDISKLNTNTQDLVNMMIDAEERLPMGAMGTANYFVPTAVRTALRKQILGKPNVNLTMDSVAGRMVQRFNDIEVIKLPTSVIRPYDAKITK